MTTGVDDTALALGVLREGTGHGLRTVTT